MIARRAWALAGVALLVAGGVAAARLARREGGDSDRTDRLAREVAGIRERLDASLRERFVEFERLLAARKAEIDQALARAGPSERERFAAWLAKDRGSVLLVCQETTIQVPGFAEPIRLGGSGTGWVADASGLVITNKHVVQPWKMDAELQAVLAERPGAVVRTTIHAWPSGERFLDPASGRFATATGWHSGAGGALRLLAVPPDDWNPVRVEMEGRSVGARVHAHSDADLALLEVAGGSFVPLPLKERPETLAALDPVMLLGFPLGTSVLEAGHADVSASLGTIRFVRDTVNHTASAFPGNSGGPLLALDGEVVGVLTRAPGVPGGGAAETFSQAIRSDAVRRFLAFARCARADPPEGGDVLRFRPEGGVEAVARAAGRVKEVVAKPGAPVAEGDPLVVLDGVDLAEAAARAQATLEAAESALARIRVLVEAAVASRAEEERALAVRDAAAAALEVARRSTTEAVVRAPAAGRVLEVTVEAGEQVAVGAVAARLLQEDGALSWKEPDAFAPGRRIALLASPQPGWRFVGWSDGEASPLRVAPVAAGPRAAARFER